MTHLALGLILGWCKKKGRDVLCDVDLSLEEVLKGRKDEINYQTREMR